MFEREKEAAARATVVAALHFREEAEIAKTRLLEQQKELEVVERAEYPDSCTEMALHVAPYSGGAGVDQEIFISDTRDAYEIRRWEANVHALQGEVQYDFLKRLGTVVKGQARKVLDDYWQKWDFRTATNPNYAAGSRGRQFECGGGNTARRRWLG